VIFLTLISLNFLIFSYNDLLFDSNILDDRHFLMLYMLYYLLQFVQV